MRATPAAPSLAIWAKWYRNLWPDSTIENSPAESLGDGAQGGGRGYAKAGEPGLLAWRMLSARISIFLNPAIDNIGTFPGIAGEARASTSGGTPRN